MTFLRTTAAILAAATGTAGLVAAAGPAAADRRGCGDHASTRRALERMTGVHRLPGAAVRVEDRRCGTWTAASGLADLRTGRPMRADERARVASVTKTFTATAVLRLADRREVALDAPVERYLPGLIGSNGYDGRKITVRSLLNHTSGLPDHSDTFASADEFRYTEFEPRELVERALRLPPPQHRWAYSTTNYVIAGMIITKVTGRPVGRHLTRDIIRPLGLRATYWPGRGEVAIRGPHPRGYVREVRDGKPVWRDYTEFNVSAGGAGGALVSDLRDLNRFFGALLNGRLVSKRALGEMRTTVETDPDRLWPGGRYGLGLIGTPLRCGGLWWGHAGNFEGYSAMGAVGPDGRRVSLMFNEVPGTLAGRDAMLEIVQSALCEGTS